MKNIISGVNIYHDDKGRTILYHKSSKTGYLIQEKDQKSYRLYSNRYVILIILFILFSNFIDRMELIAGILIVVGIGFEYAYRNKFLPSLTSFPNMKPINRVTRVEALITEGNKQKCLILGLCYLTLGVLIIINGINSNAGPILMVGNIIISVGSIYFSIINIIAFFKIKKKMN